MGLLVAAVAFVAMEPVTYAVHRWVMHGPGWVLHRSHHRPGRGRLEANDAYPVLFAAAVGTGLVVGFNVDGWGWLVPAGIGVTAYGAAYGLVHDVFVHGRLPLFRRRRPALLARLESAHRLHHRYGGEPYGMLLPVLPRRLRAPARQDASSGASGSTPSHVPVEA